MAEAVNLIDSVYPYTPGMYVVSVRGLPLDQRVRPLALEDEVIGVRLFIRVATRLLQETGFLS